MGYNRIVGAPTASCYCADRTRIEPSRPRTSPESLHLLRQPKMSMQFCGIYVGLNRGPTSLLWGLCMYHNDTWTLWAISPRQRRGLEIMPGANITLRSGLASRMRRVARCEPCAAVHHRGPGGYRKLPTFSMRCCSSLRPR